MRKECDKYFKDVFDKEGNKVGTSFDSGWCRIVDGKLVRDVDSVLKGRQLSRKLEGENV